MKKQILSEEFKRMQKLAGIITEAEAKPEENITKEKVEQIKQEVFNKVTASSEINKKVQELVDSLPEDAIANLAKNFSNLNEEAKLPVSAYSDIFSLILKRSDSLEEVSQSELSIIFDKLSNNPEITKEEIEKLKYDTAEYLSDLTGKTGSSLVRLFLPLIGLGASYAVRAAFGEVSWNFVAAAAGASAIFYLIMNAVFGKMIKIKSASAYDFEDYALDKLNKRRALQGKKPVKIKKSEKSLFLSSGLIDYIGYIFPEWNEKSKKYKKLSSYLNSKQGRLFLKAMNKKYPEYGFGSGLIGLIKKYNQFFNKWNKVNGSKFEPTPIDQVVNKNVDVEQEYQNLLKQKGLEDYVEQLDDDSED
jgi:hypothetical protein